MTTATFLDVEKPLGTNGPLGDLAGYLSACGGSDVLRFDSNEEARAAANEIRSWATPGVSVDARYESVFLKI